MPYNPALHILASDAIGFSNGTPSDARSKFYDEVLISYRPFADLQEVIDYFPNPIDREGHFPIIVIVDGVEEVYMFRNGTLDTNLVPASEGGGLEQFPTIGDFPAEGKENKLYLAKDTVTLYFWDGTTFQPITGEQLYIKNQDSTDQAASWWINGSAAIGPYHEPLPGRLTISGATGEITFNGREQSSFVQTPLAGERWSINSASGKLNIFSNTLKVQVLANGDLIVGSGSDNGARLQIQGGALSLATNPADFAILDGSLYYNGGLKKLKACVDGAWKNIATEDQIPAPINAILNQIAAAQVASFWINGTGIAAGFTATKPNGAITPMQVELNVDADAYNTLLLKGSHYKGAYGWQAGTDNFVFYRDGGGTPYGDMVFTILQSGGIIPYIRAVDPPIATGAIMYRSDMNKLRLAAGAVWKSIATEDQIPAAQGPQIDNQISVWQAAGFKINLGAAVKLMSGSGSPVTFGVYRYDDTPLFIVRDMGTTDLNGNLTITAHDSFPLQLYGNIAGGVPTISAGLAFGWNRTSGGGESNIIWVGDPVSLASYLSFDFKDTTVGTVSNKMRLHPNGDLQLMQGMLALFPNTADHGLLNGGLAFRSDTQKYRVCTNATWKNIATEDTAFMTGRYIVVDQDLTSATDTRTGLSKYSQSVPFRTIHAAIAAAANSDVVFVRRSASPYTGDIVLDPNGFSGWTYVAISLDEGVVIEGNLDNFTTHLDRLSIWCVGPNRAVINGGILSGLNKPLSYLANLIVRDGFYSYMLADTVIENCNITYIADAHSFPSGIMRNSTLNFQGQAVDYYDRGNVKFNNCELTFASSAFTYTQVGGDYLFENCRVKFTSTLMSSDQRAGAGMRFLFRNCRIAFGPYMINNGHTSPTSLIIHSCQLISNTPGTAVIINPSGGTPIYSELISTVRNCVTGVVPIVSANDIQAASITEF